MQTRPVFVLALLALTACNASPRTRAEEFRTYHTAMQLVDPEKPKNTPLFFADNFNPAGELIPYGRVSASFALNQSSDYRATELWKKGIAFMPDAMIYVEAGRNYAGSVSTYWGLGVSSSQPVYVDSAFVVLMREASCRLPFSMSSDRMILAMDIESPPRDLLEGDTVLSIGGQEVRPDQDFTRSPHLGLMLTGKPGDNVDVVAIRPGVGRVKASVQLLPNKNRYREDRSAINTTHLRVRVARRGGSGGEPFWSVTDPSDYSL